MHILLIIVFLLTAFASNQTFAQKTKNPSNKWVCIEAQSDGQACYNPARIKKTKTTVLYWVKMIGKNGAYSLDYMEAKCSEYEYRVLLSTEFNADGTVSKGYDYRSTAKFKPIFPDSVGDEITPVVCDLAMN